MGLSGTVASANACEEQAPDALAPDEWARARKLARQPGLFPRLSPMPPASSASCIDGGTSGGDNGTGNLGRGGGKGRGGRGGRRSGPPSSSGWSDYRFPRGPSSVPELFHWSRDAIRCVAETTPSKLANFAKMVRRKFLINSDYSGMLCSETALTFLVSTLRSEHPEFFESELTVEDVASDPDVCVYRACDIHKGAQRLLLQLGARPEGPQHVFQDVEDRLPAHVLARVRSMQPHVSAPRELAQESYQHMKEYLVSVKDIAYTGATSYCLKHKKHCNVSIPREVSGARVRLTAAGTTCGGFSSRGMKKREADPSMRPFHIWSQGLDQSDQDFVFQENAWSFPATLMQGALPAPKYKVLRILLCPTAIGWPIRRLRALTAAVNMDHWVWVGPPEAEEMFNDFARLFYREPAVNPEAFLIAPAAEVSSSLVGCILVWPRPELNLPQTPMEERIGL